MTLTLAEAQTMAAAVQAAAEARALHPLAIVVLDAGGHDLVVLRSERAGFHRVGIARGKATSCLGMGLDGADLADRAKAAPAFYAALAATLIGGMLPMPGGVLLRDATGLVVGAVGVSGDTGANDDLAIRDGVVAARATS
ncbi:heme-binding protein [Sphingomonas sp. UYEF23]|uniref:GlcG/HbpS family heme-binding protein n=1 Tax=Sphingomonas sp. UYEF23 TaxID=1756408 RepID=UPI0033999ECD